MIMTEEEKEKTAYHEAGHALVMLHAKGHEPLHKVTIIPRGRALGVTMWLPERDKLAHTFNELNAQLRHFLAEELLRKLFMVRIILSLEQEMTYRLQIWQEGWLKSLVF